MVEIANTFNGQRLRVARFFRGKSQEDVGHALEISQQFIGDIERGAKTPSDQLLCALADLLGFEVGFFSGASLVEFLDSECNFRRRRATPIFVRSRALAYGTLFGQFWFYATSKLNLPPNTIPTFPVNSKIEIERAVEQCRAQWGFDADTPIKNMVRVLERAGVPVARFGDVSEKVDAFSRAGRPSIVVLSQKAASRCRSDLAHECGHLVLHQGKPTGTPEMEAEADRFARAFLMPRAGFRRDFPQPFSGKWDLLFQLKRRWKASLADIIQRASDLSLVNGVQRLRLYKELSRQGWLKAEPYEFDREEPEILPQVFAQIKQSEGLGHLEIAHALGWTSETLTEITGVSHEPKFQTPKSNIRVLQVDARRKA